MDKFAKLIETEETGQILVVLDTEEEKAQINITFRVNEIATATLKMNDFNEINGDGGEERAREYFNKVLNDQENESIIMLVKLTQQRFN